jgi:hypothetical protein
MTLWGAVLAGLAVQGAIGEREEKRKKKPA